MERNVLIKHKFTPSTNQFYIYCDLSNRIPCKRTSSCKAFYYGKFNKNGLFYLKKINDTHNHARYTNSDLSNLLKIDDIPKDILEYALEFFIKGDNVSDILKLLPKLIPK